MPGRTSVHRSIRSCSPHSPSNAITISGKITREREIYIYIYLFIHFSFIYLLIHLFKYNICVYHLSYVTLSHDVTCSHTWSFRISPPRIGSVTRHPDSQAKQQEQMILITCFQWLKKIHLTEVVTAGGKGGACGSTPKYSQQ